MERREVALPKLPGFDVHAPAPIDASFKKQQTLLFKNGYAVPVDIAAQRGGPTDTAGMQQQLEAWAIPASPTAPAAAVSCPAALPKWVQHDKQCLRFMAYFVEHVPDSPAESWRTRRVSIIYYLEDDTMQVDEPREPNSGIIQGTMIKRHHVPRDAATGGGFFSPSDFVVGSSVRVYGRDLQIVDADPFTRDYSAAHGLPQPAALPWPLNPIDAYKQAKSKPSGLSRADPDSPSKFAEALLGKEAVSKSTQHFLEHGREVLRFYALWDDRAALYGDRRLFKVHFFVADNTVEVVELLEANAGKDPFTFLKRGPLPKARSGPVLGARPDPAAFYQPADLRIGGFLTVHGRQMYLFDMDAATRQWYMEHLGSSPEELAAVDVSVPRAPLPVPALPPWNGFGTPEDSLQNCVKLVPSPPKRDLYKLMNKGNIVLRFSCRLVEGGQYRLINNDRDRRFVLSFFCGDDTVSVFEPPQRNSGIVGGKYLERAKVYKPGPGNRWLEESDLYVGAVVELHGRRFLLESADDFTQERLRAFGPAQQ